MTLSGALRTLFPSFRDPLLHAEHLRFHTAANLTAMRWGLISAIVIWSMAWCMGMVLRPWHADRLAMGLACVLPFYAAVALVIDVPRFARHAQWLVLSTNITSGLLVLDVARYLPNPELVRLVGMIMVTFYAVLGVRLRAVFVLGATTLYNGLYLFILHGEQGGATEVFSVHAFLLGMAMVGALSAAVVLERNIMTLFRQRLSMQRQQHILRDEHLRSERLLRNILPTAVADQLKNGPVTVAERFDEATILFADLVDFTACSDKHPPEQVVKNPLDYLDDE